MDQSTPLHPRIHPPLYEEDPPAYGYPGESTADDNDDMTSMSGGRRNNTATMRLLPSGGNSIGPESVSGHGEDDYMDTDMERGRFSHSAAPSRQYVRTGTSVPLSSSLASSRSTRPNIGDSAGKYIPISSNAPMISSPAPDLPCKKQSEPKPKRRSYKATQTEQSLTKMSTKLAPSLERASQNQELAPAPLRLAIPKSPIKSKARCLRRITLSSIQAALGPKGVTTTHEKSDHEANPAQCRTSISPVRPSPQRYQPLNQSPPRPTSSLGEAPNIPPPTFSTTGTSPFAARPSSPTRSWSPTHSTDWSRPVAPAASVNYEPPDINGSPRPGTPSSRYGGSPRRPLPPAPLFSRAPASTAGDTSIDIAEGGDDDDDDDDVFGGRGRTVDPKDDARASLRSYGSYLSESTAVTDDKDSMSKVDLDDEKDIDNQVDTNVHYGPAPEGRQDRRGVRQAQMTKKEVKLINGELILECKIPTILHSFLPRRDDREFTHMRYTAVTCDPDDFTAKGYKLRQNVGNTMRETELLVCITMYNEDEVDFTRTMHGVMRNISHFCSRTKSRTWGKDGWQKIVVCIIADGRQKVHPRTLNALAAMGVYQDGIAKNIVNQKEVTAHVYEYTTQVSLDSDLKFKGAEKGIVPCQMMFCLKEKNQKKLNSHRWLFNAFGRALTPNVCIMLDVGTKPAPTALYHLWKAFDQDSNVAGAAGEIKAGKGKNFSGLLNPLVASQNFEYKMSNILDKPLESVFGYITVLPGALSAYRYHALQNDSTGHGPLSQYFKGEMLHGQNADVFTANMYLAEDRILCWELVAKREEQWVLKFVKSAVGETDVPGILSFSNFSIKPRLTCNLITDAVPEFISQRRRWLNGAFFAAVYSLVHFRQVWGTDHTLARKILLHIEFVYQFVSLAFTFFSLVCIAISLIFQTTWH